MWTFNVLELYGVPVKQTDSERITANYMNK